MVYLGVVLVAAPAAGLVTAALAVVQVAALGVLGRRGRVLRREELVALAKYGSWVYEAASTIAWVKGSGAEDVIGAKAARLRGRQLDALHRAGRNDALAQAVASAMRTAGPLVLLVVVTATAAGASVGGRWRWPPSPPRRSRSATSPSTCASCTRSAPSSTTCRIS